jgi:diacylglycerol kinase family enzyme
MEDVMNLSARARTEGVSALIVAGGDGTISNALETLAYSDLPVLVIPNGTENLLACEFGLDGSLQSNIALVRNRRTCTLDLARANDRVYMAVAGFGFDAEVINRIHQVRTGHITHYDYIWPLCRTFGEYHFPHFHVEADGECVCDEPALVFVGNISRYAAGLKIQPDADGTDGWLDLTVFKCRNQWQLLEHSARTLFDRAQEGPRITRRKCRRVRVSSDHSDIPVQLDGDPGPVLPIDIEIMPAAAKILIPETLPDKNLSLPALLRFYLLRRWLLR